MDMVTTCPQCGTSFRVTPDHLRARAGQVRCGRCATVFDGFKSLAMRDNARPPATATAPAPAPQPEVPQEAMPIAETAPVAEVARAEARPQDLPSISNMEARPVAPPPSAPTSEPPLPAVEPGATNPPVQSTTELPASATAAEPDTPVQPEFATPIDIELLRTQDMVAPAESTPASVADSAALEPVPADLAASLPAQDVYKRLTPVEPIPQPLTRESVTAEPEYSQEDETPKRMGWPWAVAAVIALAVLAGQVIYVYRDEMASKYPALKPALAQFCGYAGCKVLPLQRPQLIKIEASDLQVHDPSRPSVIQLTATLRNYSSIEVGYPGLDLVLTDNREHTLVRRVLSPAEYLARPDALSAGIAANAEVTLRIDIDIGNIAAAGFRLNLLNAISI